MILKTPKKKGNKKRLAKANTNAIIPINLSGTDLSIAYNGKKYHSGTI
jgi:hypothetical protein